MAVSQRLSRVWRLHLPVRGRGRSLKNVCPTAFGRSLQTKQEGKYSTLLKDPRGRLPAALHGTVRKQKKFSPLPSQAGSCTGLAVSALSSYKILPITSPDTRTRYKRTERCPRSSAPFPARHSSHIHRRGHSSMEPQAARLPFS